MAETQVRQKLSAVFAAGAAGFSPLMAADEHATLFALDAARAVFMMQIDGNHGRVIDMAGHSVLAVFETATGAVGAALTIQQQLDLSTSTVVQGERMKFRIGVHLGDIIEKHDGTVSGDGVNIASLLDGSGRTRRHCCLRRGARCGARPCRGELRRYRRAAVEGHCTPHSCLLHRNRRSGGRSASSSGSSGSSGTTGHKVLGLASKGFGNVVLLAGSGGMGKTRLTQELAFRAEAAGTPVLWGRCLEEAGAPAYWP